MTAPTLTKERIAELRRLKLGYDAEVAQCAADDDYWSDQETINRYTEAAIEMLPVVLDAYEALAAERDRFGAALEEIAPSADSSCDCCEYPGSVASRALAGEREGK